MEKSHKAFLKAAKSGDLEQLKTLAAQDSSVIEARDLDGSSALHCAAWKGHQLAVGYLIELGCDPNLHNLNDHWGTTPLHAAAHGNHPTIVRLLIESGAKLNEPDMNGKTPLFHTTFHRANAAAKVLTQFGAV
jgi:ankyrin repeat protein